MAGLLSNEINNTDKISTFVGECKRMGIPILPPDVNRSGLKFSPEAVAAGASSVAAASGHRESVAAASGRRESVAAASGRREEGNDDQRSPLQKGAIRYGLA